MKQKRRIYGYVLAAILTLVIGGPKAGSAGAADRPEEGELGVSNSPLTGDEFERGARAVLVTTDLCPGGRDGAATTAAGMVMALFGGITPGKVGGAATIGKCEATGIFAGGTFQLPVPADGMPGPVGINSGVILSSGDIFDARGGPPGAANTIDSMSTPWGLPGDADLNALKLPGATTDAAGLTFTITIAPNTPQRFACQYVFASDEYNEWVGSTFNDIFGAFINGANVAVIPAACGGPAGVPVSINNINGGNPFPGAAPPNSMCFRDWPGGVTNDCSLPGPGFPCAPPLLEFEPDGSTTVLIFAGNLPADPDNDTVYNVKLVIADNRDRIYDSDVFIVCSLQAGACSIPDPPDSCICLNVLDQDECTALGGEFEPNVSCDDLEPPCELIGACCQAFGTCAQTTLSLCTAGGGTYLGDGTSCGPIGACNINQDCVETSETCCNGAGGTYVGDGTFCPVLGACCFDDGNCTDLLASDCANQSGDYQGDGTFCFGDNNGNGIDDACEPHGIPAVTEWGMIVMVLLALTAGTVVFARWRRQTAA